MNISVKNVPELHTIQRRNQSRAYAEIYPDEHKIMRQEHNPLITRLNFITPFSHRASQGAMRNFIFSMHQHRRKENEIFFSFNNATHAIRLSLI